MSEEIMENQNETSMAKAIEMIEELKFKFKVDPSFRITNKNIKEIRVGETKYRNDSINSDGVHVTRAMVKSFFIILNSDVINDEKLEGNIKKKIKILNALFGHKELRTVTLLNKDYRVTLSLPFKYRNDIYANKYMHTGVDKDGNIYIYVGKDFDDDPVCNGYRKYMKIDKAKKLRYEKLSKKDVKKSFKKANLVDRMAVYKTPEGAAITACQKVATCENSNKDEYVPNKMSLGEALAKEAIDAANLPDCASPDDIAKSLQKDLDAALEDSSQKIGVRKDVEKFVND